MSGWRHFHDTSVWAALNLLQPHRCVVVQVVRYLDLEDFVRSQMVSKRWHVVVSSDTINIQEIGTFSYLGFCPMDATENVLVVFDIETENHCARGCIGLSGTLQRGS
ncbi:hypothetical protein VTN31DRAFT_5335 [Thermomyces dupontii]|uniref:uncharacterized protein n=1 Tax=Talaromyces thermophilus TaxID=28565 RepID=UPI003742CD5E